MDKIYKQHKPLMDERTRRIAQRQAELNRFLQGADNQNQRILNQRENAFKIAQELEKNYLQVAKKEEVISIGETTLLYGLIGMMKN